MFGTTNSYMSLDAWILANIVQLATFDFCRRFLSPAADPCGRQFDQMTQAARRFVPRDSCLVQKG